MSLLPFFDDYSRPSRLLDQHFGVVLDPEDLFAPLAVPRDFRTLTRCPVGYLRPWRTAASQQDLGSTVSLKDGSFHASLDVQHFAPEEVTVKATGDNTITIEGKHEEKPDEHGYISRQFLRKYVLPKGVDINKVESKLSTDGVLTITAPKATENPEEHRPIPITQTGQPSRPLEQKKEETKKEETKKEETKKGETKKEEPKKTETKEEKKK